MANNFTEFPSNWAEIPRKFPVFPGFFGDSQGFSKFPGYSQFSSDSQAKNSDSQGLSKFPVWPKLGTEIPNLATLVMRRCLRFSAGDAR